ncbi:LPO_1073/Vpar_1526 family protein [Streptodolium elevatio]|uniref:LPO_1073/Vpar_1526 family protein n=1 Tax=Streptodolium elevatio TaxID=3157996 RepID=A0ABV3DR12_9ACTN
MIRRQRQRSGDNSTNIQAEVVRLGPSYEDVAAIARDTFRANFLALSTEAAHLAEARAADIVDAVLHRLAADAPDRLALFAEPWMQRCLFKAQEIHAFRGDAAVEGVLIETIVAQTNTTPNTHAGIVLEESLLLLPRLTHTHLTMLALTFVVREAPLGPHVESYEALRAHTRDFVVPFVSGLNPAPRDTLHLLRLGCATKHGYEESPVFAEVGWKYLARWDEQHESQMDRDAWSRQHDEVNSKAHKAVYEEIFAEPLLPAHERDERRELLPPLDCTPPGLALGYANARRVLGSQLDFDLCEALNATGLDPDAD